MCVCAARACAMTPVWRSEDSFAGVSSPTFMLAWARAVSAFYSQNHLSGPHLFFVFDSRGAASWIQRAWLHTGDISELWRTFFFPFSNESREGARRTYSPTECSTFLSISTQSFRSEAGSMRDGWLADLWMLSSEKGFQDGNRIIIILGIAFIK